MNPNSKKPGYLFFTPRTPWGTRAGQQSFRQHQRASEDARADADEKHLLWGKEQQGLGAQMATEKSPWRNGAERTLDKQGVPRSLNGQLPPPAQPTGAASQVPHSDLQPYQQQQQRPAPSPLFQQPKGAPLNGEKPNTWSERNTAGNLFPAAPTKEPHFEGEAGYEGTHPASDEKRTRDISITYKLHPEVNTEQEDEKQKKWEAR